MLDHESLTQPGPSAEERGPFHAPSPEGLGAVGRPTPHGPARDEWIGRVLDDRYRIDAHLAAGGFGVVYRGTQLAIERPVAIKILHRTLATSPDHAARFRQEARALAQVRHPGVVQVIDFGALAGDALFLVMELLEGPTLAAHLAEHGPMAPSEVIELGLAALEALAEAHERGVFHRDVKPDNILLVRRGERRTPVLVDFGIAKFAGRSGRIDSVLTQTGMVLGSPRYLSPEQVRDLPVSDKTDIYSLGVVLYEALLGRPAFTRPGVSAYLAAHLSDPPDPPAVSDTTGGCFINTVLRFMAKDPGERPDARQAVALLEACRAEATRVERPRATQSREPEPTRTAAGVVGRRAELAAFERLLAGEGGLRILSFIGPGGMGKTTLLNACCEHARARGLSVERLDGAELANLPQLLSVTFAPIVGAPPDLLVIDRLEQAWGLVDGLRDGILPRLPPRTRVLLAGRRELGWDVHPTLSEVALEMRLESLSVADSCALLAARGVPEELRLAAHDEAGGHPLALALLADLQRGSHAFARKPTRLRDAPSMLHRLAREMVEQVPSEAHRTGLLAASVVRRLTADDLRHVVPAALVADVHRWLSELSCARTRHDGLELHELMRRVIVLETRLHAPERLSALVETLGARALARLREAPPERFHRSIVDVGYVFGHLLPLPFDPLDIQDSRPIMPARAEHWSQIEAMLERFEGARAVDTLRAWRGPHSDTVVVCEGDVVLGFATGLRLDSAPDALVARDPGTASFARLMFDERGLPRDRATLYFRFWSGPEHHLPSRAQTKIFLHFLLLATTVQDLGAIASAHHPPDFWRAMHAASAHEMYEAAAFSIDGRDFLPFGRDFIGTSRRKWIIEHFERMFTARHAAPPAPAQRPERGDGDFDSDLMALGRPRHGRAGGIA